MKLPRKQPWPQPHPYRAVRCDVIVEFLALPKHYRDELMEELEKPRSEQVLTVDHVLEASRGAEALAKREIISNETAAELVEAVIDKFRNRVEKNTTAPRHLPAIARAVERGDVGEAIVRRAVARIIQQPTYTVERAFQDIGAEPKSRKAIGDLVDRSISQIDSHIERGFKLDAQTTEKLKLLMKRIRELLAS